MLKTTPAVFAVGTDYQIMVPVEAPSLFWVEIGEQKFYDEQNGVMRSLCTTHRVTVPMEVLDQAGEYRVCEKEIIDRKPYFPETKKVVKTTYRFFPLPKENIRVYHMADTHNMVDLPVAAANVFGNIDLLILNGDIPDHSGDVQNYLVIYQLIERITGGQKPVVFARGNHDLRGIHAEEMAEYTPNHQGNTYYTFRLGPIWGVVLDCGEDKNDRHPEYGHTVSCHGFRERQTAFLESVIQNRKNEYAARGVRYKLVICHNPFTYAQESPFNIEKEIFSTWARLLKEEVNPHLMLAGHLHKALIVRPGDKGDRLGQPCTMIIGSDKKKEYHLGCGLVFQKGNIESVFCDSNGETFAKTVIKPGKP